MPDTVIISNLPSHSPSGSDYLAVENDSLTGKATINDVVGASGSVVTLNSQVSTLNNKFSSFLPDGTNIDNWNTTGFWLYQRTSPRSHTGTFPYSDSYGTLIHVQGTSTNVAMQMIRSNSIGKSYSTLYVRFKDSTWGSWFTFEDNALKSGNISVTSGWTVQNNNNWCRKSGHVAEFYLEVTGGTLASGWNNLGTLPSGFTPLFTINIVGIDNGYAGVPACQVQVQSNGVINVYKNSTLTNNLRIFGVYLVA